MAKSKDIKIERKWAMPNRWTFTIPPIRDLLSEEVEGKWVDPFAGENSPAEVTNDLNPEMPTNFHLDALAFLRTQPTAAFDGAFFDPPYSITQATECYRAYGRGKLEISVSNMAYWARVKDELARVIKPGGKAICFGWTSMGLGKSRNFRMVRVLLVPHGGSKNDTIVTVEIKNG